MTNTHEEPEAREVATLENPLIKASEGAISELRKTFPDARITMLFHGPDNMGIEKSSAFASEPKDKLIFMASTVKPLIAAAVLNSLYDKSGLALDMNMPISMRWQDEEGEMINKFSGEEDLWVKLLNKNIPEGTTKITPKTLPEHVTLQQTLDAVLGNSANGPIGAWYQHLISKELKSPRDIVQAYVNSFIKDDGQININGSEQSKQNGVHNVADPQTLFDTYRKLLSNEIGLNDNLHDAIVQGIRSAVGSHDLELNSVLADEIQKKGVMVTEKAGWFYDFTTRDGEDVDKLATDNGVDSGEYSHLASFNLLARLVDAAGRVRDVGIMVSIPYTPQDDEKDEQGELVEEKISKRIMPEVRRAIFEPLGGILMGMFAQP